MNEEATTRWTFSTMALPRFAGQTQQPVKTRMHHAIRASDAVSILTYSAADLQRRQKYVGNCITAQQNFAVENNRKMQLIVWSFAPAQRHNNEKSRVPQVINLSQTENYMQFSIALIPTAQPLESLDKEVNTCPGL